MSQQGSLACVGLGMMLGAHLSPRSRSHIEQADVVFVLVSDPLVELWVQEMRPDMRSLQPFYCEGTSRLTSYNAMVEAMLVDVRAGHRVCGVFYGHPGVFALVPHKAIQRAHEEGLAAHMEPGISAEDCLYADLGIDPGKYGCQHYEASQLMFYQRRIDPSFSAAPLGVELDTPEQIGARADQIDELAVQSRVMPLGNATGMTEAERELLGRWIDQGAKVEP